MLDVACLLMFAIGCSLCSGLCLFAGCVLAVVCGLLFVVCCVCFVVCCVLVDVCCVGDCCLLVAVCCSVCVLLAV